MNEEILAGIKNAMVHGFSIEEAANSFTNAGNNSSEVKEVVSYITKGVSPLPSLSRTTETAVQKEMTAQKGTTPTKPQASGRLIWILVILAVLAVVGIVLSYFLL